jgi:hypothetical protein
MHHMHHSSHSLGALHNFGSSSPLPMKLSLIVSSASILLLLGCVPSAFSVEVSVCRGTLRMTTKNYLFALSSSRCLVVVLINTSFGFNTYRIGIIVHYCGPTHSFLFHVSFYILLSLFVYGPGHVPLGIQLRGSKIMTCRSPLPSRSRTSMKSLMMARLSLLVVMMRR